MFSQEFRESWKKLQNAYLNSLGEKLAELEQLWQRGARQQADADSLTELYRKAHSLAGSGAMYGLDEVSAMAKKLELFVKAFIEEKRLYSPEEEAHYATLYSALCQAADGGRSGEPAPPPSTPPDSGAAGIFNFTGSRTLGILVAEDDEASRAQLVLMLESLGHTVYEAADGKQAVALFEQKQPDLVLMDIIMPEMNGHQAAKIIKQQSGETFIPIIFLTAATDEDNLIESINVGGDDFLPKPYNRLILQAKIHALQRIERLHKQLQVYKERTEEEVRLARHVYERIVDRNEKHFPGLERWSEAAGHFSGDIILYKQAPDGSRFVFLGDFTGHGMAAALGGMEVADVFYATVSKNLSSTAMLCEMNRKLNETLPIGRYCAGTLLEISKNDQQLRMWNCGLPDTLLRTPRGVERHASKNLPLGVIPGGVNDFQSTDVTINGPMCVMVYSDGVTEATDPQCNMYGEERLIQVFQSEPVGSHTLINKIKQDVGTFTQQGELMDDISIVHLNVGQE